MAQPSEATVSGAGAPPGLWVERGDGVHLIAARRRSDQRVAFPMPDGAEAAHYARLELPPRGLLWSFTVQRFSPKAPFIGASAQQSFAPYAVGYVEFPELVIVEGRIVIDDFAKLEIGMPMRVTLEMVGSDQLARQIFAFAPESAA